MFNANEFAEIKQKYVGSAKEKIVSLEKEMKELEAKIAFKQKQIDSANAALIKVEENYLNLEVLFAEENNLNA